MRTAGYVASGRVEPAFAAWGLAAIGAALVGATLLHVAFVAGIYLIVLFPLLVGVLIGAAVVYAVRLGRCRNRGAAVALGIAAGLVGYFGQFQVGLAHEEGAAAFFRVDLLPAYVSARQREQTIESTTSARRPSAPSEGLNWTLLVAEAGLVCGVGAMAAWASQTRAYCEDCGQWKDRTVAFFYPGEGERLARAIRKRDWEAIAVLPPFHVATTGQSSYTAVAVETCAGGECPAYLSLKEVRAGGGAFEFARFDGSRGTMVVRQRELAVEDAESLSEAIARRT